MSYSPQYSKYTFHFQTIFVLWHTNISRLPRSKCSWITTCPDRSPWFEDLHCFSRGRGRRSRLPHCHHMAERNCVTVSYCSLWGGARRREGGLTVSYCHENNLLHLNLGCHPKWDFCHHKWDSKIPSGVADFSNEFLQKLNQITVKRGGRARAAAHTSHFRWQNFIVKW